MPIYRFNLERLGRTYFEFYRIVAPSTETRDWSQLSDFARRTWIMAAMNADAGKPKS